MATPYYPPPGSNPTDPVARPNTTPAPPPPVTDTRAWVQSRMPVWARTNPYLDPNSVDYMVTQIEDNGGLNDPKYNAAYWDQKMSTPPPLLPGAGTHSGTRNAATDPFQIAPPTSDLMSQIMEELRAQQTGEDSPRTRQVHLDMLGRPR